MHTGRLITILIAFCITSCDQPKSKHTTSSDTTSIEILTGNSDSISDELKNKQLVSQIFEQVINKKNVSFFDSVYIENVIDHSAFEGQRPGVEGFKSSVNQMFD